MAAPTISRQFRISGWKITRDRTTRKVVLLGHVIPDGDAGGGPIEIPVPITDEMLQYVASATADERFPLPPAVLTITFPEVNDHGSF